MADIAASMTVHGVDEILATLRSLPADIRDKILKRAMKTAAQDLAEAVRRRAPVSRPQTFSRWSPTMRFRRTRGSGTLRNAIAVAPDDDSDMRAIHANVYARAGRKRGIGGAYYAHMVEFGHAIVVPKFIKGRDPEMVSIGRKGPNPFMSSAAAEGLPQFVSTFRDALQRDLDRIARARARNVHD